MDSKEEIVKATIDLINERGENVAEITVRDICKRANVGLGLINYHFGNKDKLIEFCVERIINGIVAQFAEIRQKTEDLPPFEKLEYLGNLTLDFLFDHYTVSRISVLTDMHTPKQNDNTHRTYLAFLPLVSACRPDLDESSVARKTFCLITCMQQAFLRNEFIFATQGINLKIPEERHAFHKKMLEDLELGG